MRLIDLILKQPILITGASSGIGFKCARALHQLGATKLILTGRIESKLHDACSIINTDDVAGEKQNANHVQGVACDHSQLKQIDYLLETLASHDWWVDCQYPQTIIANVGINPVHTIGPRKVHTTDYQVFMDTVTVNLSNTFYLISHLLKQMRIERQGRILLVGSQAYQQGILGQVAYNVSKSGLVGLKNSIVSEYRRNNIFCHLINPGLVLNNRTKQLRNKNPNLIETHGISEDDVVAKMIELISINDPGKNGLEINV